MVVLLWVLPTFICEAKSIRLRHEMIDTDTGLNRAVLAGQMRAQIPTTGLYLIQCDGPLASEQRNEMKKAGVELIQYVPDDTYIAKLTEVSPASVGGFSYVRWIGPYRKEYKQHPRLSAPAKPAANTNQTVSVNILLSPTASRSEIAAVRAQLSMFHHQSQLQQGMIMQADILPVRLEALAQSDATLWIEPAPKRKLFDEFASKIVGGDDGALATRTVTQQLGFDGTGVTVCVADTGLDTGDTNTMHPDLFGRVVGFQHYGNNITDGSDGYGHGTHCAGIVAGNAATGETDPDDGGLYGLGIAPGAKLFIERIFDDNAAEASPFPSDETLTHDAVRHGAKIGSNSWGNDTQGEYDLDCMQFDALVRDADAGTPGDQPFILEFSAGNSGPASQTIGSPACAKNVIATGASQNVPGTLAATYGLYADGPDTMADFSSRGPCADGRIKPDLVAPGTWIASAASAYAYNLAGTSWTVIDDYYVYMGGTSMSGPYAAGAAAVFVQFYKSWHTNAVPSPALVKAALINSAAELDQSSGGPSPVPNNDEGWGRITLTNIITTNVSGAPRYYQYLDQSVLLTNGQVYAQHVFVQSASQPLKITLAYTDVPGFPGAIPALVNDLDLEVVAPDGTLYRGNQFGAGVSVPNPPTPDKLNNVEGVYLSQPVLGDYQVRVRGSRIVQDSITNTPGVVDQDFALVSSGDLVRPGTGIILLDRSTYAAPGVMNIAVIDGARAASNSVIVTVTNLTARTSVIKILTASGNYGAFTGAVATVTSPAGAGQIQITNGDSLEADYLDSKGIKRIASASADLVAPVINSVASGLDAGVLTITWQTGEPATSVVRYGTNSSSLNLGVTNLALVTSHVVKLSGLIPGKTYYYLIVSAEAAGNTATNNNGGSYYNFTGVATPTVLLVDAYDTAVESANGATVIPDSAYTNVLAAAGISYGFWKVNDRGGPQLADLQAFPVVIWRMTDDAINYGVDEFGSTDPTATNNTLNAQQQFMIQTYLNGGGSFFMASMEILSHLGNSPFRRNVLQVDGFKQNTSLLGVCSDCDEDFGVPAFFGLPASIAGGMSMTLDYTNYPSFDPGNGDGTDLYGPDFSDTFTPSSDATAVVFESASGRPCGMSYPNLGVDSPGRVIFLSFPFDTIPTNGIAPNNAVTLMKNIIKFLAPGVNGIGAISLDNKVYTTNSALTAEVGDSDLAGTGQTQVSFVASSHPGKPVIVTLSETMHPGLFRGTLTLVSASAATNQLQVANGDTITAAYFDASGGSNVTATAGIDTVPPGITNVAAATDFFNARVTWATSKAADSAVQYGSLDQPPINSVYDPTLVTNHSITISGLLPNRIYHYQVVSRDLAGNTAVDDNSGNFYPLKTLKAPTPPWSTDLEAGTNGWTRFMDSGSEVNWRMGKPNSSLAMSAHSGTNVWGCLLEGEQPLIQVGSYLCSPAIDLSGLKSATLHFYDTYDFSQEIFGYPIEDGGILIRTNFSVAPAYGSVPVAADFIGLAVPAWEYETVDLTPWVGKTIQVVFYYQGVAIFDPLKGWLVDDISITGVVAGGNVSLTKNLGQGNWVLSSHSSLGLVPVQSGTARFITISNLPPAEYVVQFGDVPYYQAPPAQTNTLVVDGSLNFTGNYTFPDANSNGISDSFERNYFSSVSTNRTNVTDTDGDGMTDYAEFIAGTNPADAASRFYFTGETIQRNGLVQLQWTVVPNRLYQVYSSSNLSNWVTNTDWMQAATNPVMSYTATNTGGARFYRVQVLP